MSHELVVVVPIYGLTPELPELLDSLAAVSVPGVHHVLIDDFSKNNQLDELFKIISEKYGNFFEIIRNLENRGYLRNVNDMCAKFFESDILVINSDAIVNPGLPEALLRLSKIDNTIATISIWASSGSILTPEIRNLDPGSDLKYINQRLSMLNASLLTIPVAVGHVIYFRRAALNVVGDLDDRFHPGYGEEVEFSIRAIRAGFRNVLAEGHFAYHRGKGSFSNIDDDGLQIRNDKKFELMFPEYKSYLLVFHSIIEGAKYRFSIAVFGLNLAFDASSLNYPASGTSTITWSILKELNNHHIGQVTAIIDREITKENLIELLTLESISVKYLDEEIRSNQKYDLFWRPYQIWEEWRLALSSKISSTYILGVQDLIGFDNYSYHETIADWNNYRNVMRHACDISSGLTFISQYTKNRALESGLLTTQPFRVIANGIDSAPRLKNSRGSEILAGSSSIIILMIGMNFEHKNFNYAFKLAAELRSLGLEVRIKRIGHGVFNPPVSSTINYEDLGVVSEEEKASLFSEASFVLYPSVVEGFGLIPFEASMHGVFTFSTRQGGLEEFLPSEIQTILTWDAKVDAIQLLESQHKFPEYVSKILDSAGELSWNRNVSEHLAFFFGTLFLKSKQTGFDSSIHDPIPFHESNRATYFRIILRNRLLRLSIIFLPIGSRRRKFCKKLIIRA
jgi:GT2 family glycosyltransferase/glycosyltransferase involved in cell wall biosynthesis